MNHSEIKLFFKISSQEVKKDKLFKCQQWFFHHKWWSTISQQMKKNSAIRWQWCHLVRSYQHEFCDTKSSEHMKTQNVTNYEKFWWTIFVLNVLCSCEAIIWRTSWICVYVFDRFKRQIQYDTRILMIEEA